jgi:hypothetical protein
MLPSPHHDDLLSEMFSSANVGPHDDVLLETTLRAVRKRRRLRRVRRIATGFVALGLVAIGVWRFARPIHTMAPDELGSALVEVATQPFPAEAVVRTTALKPEFVVSTRPDPSLVLIASRPGGYQLWSDDQLLAFLGPGSAALTGKGTGSVRLIFLDREKEQELRVQ